MTQMSENESNEQENPLGKTDKPGNLEKTEIPAEDREIVIPKSVLEELPRDVQIKVTQSASSYKFSGPMPHPELYASYEEILPGSAERLLSLTEKQAEHRTSWETKALDASIRHAARGQIFGLVVALVAIGGAIYLGSQGQNVVGGFLVIASVMGFVDQLVRRFVDKSED